MFDSGIVFDLYRDDCFYKVVVHFNSRICVWEFSGHINE